MHPKNTGPPIARTVRCFGRNIADGVCILHPRGVGACPLTNVSSCTRIAPASSSQILDSSWALLRLTHVRSRRSGVRDLWVLQSGEKAVGPTSPHFKGLWKDLKTYLGLFRLAGFDASLPSPKKSGVVLSVWLGIRPCGGEFAPANRTPSIADFSF